MSTISTNAFQIYDTYDRDRIMNLKGFDLLDYVNTMLANGYGFKQLCEAKGLRNKTIRQRLKDQCNAVYNMKMRRYYVVEGDEVNKGNKDITDVIQSSTNTSDIQQYPNSVTPSNTNNTQQYSNSITTVSHTDTEGVKEGMDALNNTNTIAPTTATNTVIEDLTQSINALMNEIVRLNGTMTEVNETTKATNTVKQTKQINTSSPSSPSSMAKFEVIPFTGEIKARPIKVYPEVLERLDAFCSNYPQYSKQRVISTLLVHALNIYDK